MAKLKSPTAPRKPRARKVASEVLPAVQPTANSERGEHELTLAGTSYLMRPSHAALVAIETKTEKSIIQLVNLGNSGAMTLTVLGICAAELIRAGAKDEATRHVGEERLSQLVMEEGLPGATSRVMLCLLDAATGGRDAAGNAKPEPV